MEGAGWRVEGTGWRVEPGGWRVQGGGWEWGTVEGVGVGGCRVQGGGWRAEGAGLLEFHGVEGRGWRVELGASLLGELASIRRLRANLHQGFGLRAQGQGSAQGSGLRANLHQGSAQGSGPAS